MRNLHDLPRVRLGVFPTPFYRLDRLSEQYGRGIWIKRDDLCGVALGGNKVRKLEFLLADAQRRGCDTVLTTGGAQSNHAMLTAACAARLGMRCELLLKKRGVTGVKAVYSTEEALTPQAAQAGDTKGTAGRPTPGSMAFVPSVAGLILAGEIVRDLLDGTQQ